MGLRRERCQYDWTEPNGQDHVFGDGSHTLFIRPKGRPSQFGALTLFLSTVRRAMNLSEKTKKVL
jgi:hypothetical protein